MKATLILFTFLYSLGIYAQSPEEIQQMEDLKVLVAAQEYNDTDLDKVKAYFNQPDFKLVFDDMLAEGMEEAVFAKSIISGTYDQAVASNSKEEVDIFIYGFLSIIERNQKFDELNEQLDKSLSALEKEAPFTLEHVALSVRDVDASAAFYGKTFGLSEIYNRGEVAGIRWFSLGSGRELHLISTVPGNIETTKAAHFAVTAADFESFVMRIQNAGIPYQDWAGTPNTISLRPDGVKQVYVKDPDGYWIEINSPRPKD
ncbi:MAG: VOC family protein [Gilvibacter sp.]